MQLTIPPPNAKQAEFFRSRARFTAYGGARGGGKSWAVRQKAKLLACRYDGIRILILRRTYSDLQDNHIKPLCSDTLGAAMYTDKHKTLTFLNGSTIKFGYYASESDEMQYQGQEYDVIFIDEATQFPETTFTTIKACLRGVNTFPKRMYLTCNPGGIGHAWVKRLFVDRIYRADEDPSDYAFIQARVQDNKILMDSDPDYIKMLMAQPPGRREAWLEGRWDVYAGQYFREFDRDIHVVEPFAIPPHWRIYRSMDYGLDMLAVLWIAVDEHGSSYVIRELCQPELIISAAARAIIDAQGSGDVYESYAPPDMWSRGRDSGKTQEELFREGGVDMIKAGNDRVAGWMALSERLTPRETVNVETGEAVRRPKMMIFSTCRELIRCLPLLQYDDKNPSDCSTEPHDITHICDALRYFAIMRPSAAVVKTEQTRLQKARENAIKASGGNRRYRF